MGALRHSRFSPSLPNSKSLMQKMVDLVESLPKFAFSETNGRFEKLQYNIWVHPHEVLSLQLFLPVGLGFSGLQGSYCA